LHIFQSLQGVLCILILVDGDQGVEDEDEQDDEWLNVGGDSFFSIASDGNDERDGRGQKKNTCK